MTPAGVPLFHHLHVFTNLEALQPHPLGFYGDFIQYSGLIKLLGIGDEWGMGQGALLATSPHL